MAVAEESKLVQMRLLSRTIERIERLSQLTGTENRTQVVAASIQLTEQLVTTVKNGGKIFIENKDGSRELLRITGIE